MEMFDQSTYSPNSSKEKGRHLRGPPNGNLSLTYAGHCAFMRSMRLEVTSGRLYTNFLPKVGTEQAV